MGAKEKCEKDLYELLGIDFEAGVLEIRKAYRKKALQCHPDKNPDNPRSAELFHELAAAVEILTNPAVRANYDKILKAKKASEIRNKALDSKRQKFKADLEKREQDFYNREYKTFSYNFNSKSDQDIFEDQIENLRREGTKILEEERRTISEQQQKAMEERKRSAELNSAQYRIKIKWNAERRSSNNGGYTEEKLLLYMKKYGDIVALVMSKKPGSALVEFKSLEAAEMALSYEKGMLENTLKLEWVLVPEQTSVASSTPSSSDFENLVLRKLRQAEERKRLIKEMREQDFLDV